MAKFMMRPVTFEAVRWFRAKGGHPDVVLHAMHRIAGGDRCAGCGHRIRDHGYLDKQQVCPGDYIVTKPNGEVHVCAAKDFEKTCVPVSEAQAALNGGS
jgi:hypothetical protein